MEVFGALRGVVRVGESWMRAQRGQTWCPGDRHELCPSLVWSLSHWVCTSPNTQLRADFPKNPPTPPGAQSVKAEGGKQAPVTLRSPGSGGSTAELPGQPGQSSPLGTGTNPAVASSQSPFPPAPKTPLPACPSHLARPPQFPWLRVNISCRKGKALQ